MRTAIVLLIAVTLAALPTRSPRAGRRDDNRARRDQSVLARSGVAPLTMALASRRIQSPRRIVHHEWKAQWMRGGKREESLFGLPREMVASNEGVFVADGGGLEVMSFTPEGRLRWRIGRKGGGPGEFQHLDDITLDAHGNVIVLDPFNARLTMINRDGSLARTTSTGAVPWVSGICVLANGSVSTLTSSTEAFVTVLDSIGRVQHKVAFPWNTAPDAPSFLRDAHFARGIARDHCWLATVFGFGISRVASTGSRSSLTTMPFVEAVDAPIIRTEPATTKRRGGQFLEKGDNAAVGAFTSGDTLFVHFMGKFDNTKPLLDLYDATGRYVESWNLPAGSEQVAYANGVLYTLANTMEAAAVIAWKTTALAPVKKGKPLAPRSKAPISSSTPPTAAPGRRQ